MTEPSANPWALAVADANWYTTEHLFRAASPSQASTLLLHCLDYRNAWTQGRRPFRNWSPPTHSVSTGVWRRDLALPSGWMKRFPRWGMVEIARTVKKWMRAEAAGKPLALVMTYPYYLHLRDQLQPARSIYYNVDDYALYWPGSADEVRALELKAVRESDLTICVARTRWQELTTLFPDFAQKIIHLPHGAPSGSIPPEPFHRPGPAPADVSHLPRPLLGYVGSLEDRVDWELVTEVALAFPKASIVLIGRIDAVGRPGRARCLALPNVHALGWHPQAEIASYNQAFDVCLIPYDVVHPFNLACCPTKIMDTMGSGRPMVSTAIPECRLSRHLFDVAESTAEFIASIDSILGNRSDDQRSQLRWEWARENTCEKVVARLIDAIPKVS